MRLRLEKHKLMTVVLIAIIARAGVLVAFPQHFAFSEPDGVIHGSAAYDEYALNLLETGVYGREAGLPDVGLPPLYSYLLAVGLRRLRPALPGGRGAAHTSRRAFDRSALRHLPPPPSRAHTNAANPSAPSPDCFSPFILT